MKSHNILMTTEALILDKSGQVKRKVQIGNSNEEAIVRLTQKDSNGNTKRVHEQPMKSFVSNFARVLNNSFLNIDNSTAGASLDKIIKTTTGGITYPAAAIHQMDINEGALTASAQTAYGIWIGDKDNNSGLGLTQESAISAVERFDDYRLRTLVLADGGSPDTDVEFRATSISLSGDQLTISRRFQNNNAASVYVDEIGIVAKSGSDYFLIARDNVNIETPSVTVDYLFEVPTTDILVVEYVFAISSNSGFTKNYLKMIDSSFRGGAAISNPRDINGNYYTVDFSSARTQKDLLAAAGAITHGIVIAGYSESNYENQGGGPVLSTDSYKLANTILLDAEMDYGAVVPISLEQVGDLYTQFGLYRDFENVLTERVHVYEAGLYMKEAAASHYYMLTRAILSTSSGVFVDPGEILRVITNFQFLLHNTTSEVIV